MSESSAVQLRRWTRREYDRMIDAGVLAPEDRVELIEGEILAITPQGAAHVIAVSRAYEALRTAVGPGFHVRMQFPLAFGTASEPEPDVAVVRGAFEDYRDHHPGTAALVIEIADSTLMHDRDVKAGLYARFAIPEYWIVNLVDRLVEVHRDPEPDERARYGFHYRRVDRHSIGDTIVPHTLPTARIAVADLLP